MKYVGSKAKIAKELLSIMLPDDYKRRLYVEPFVGGGNVIQHVDSKYRMGIDINIHVIEALKFIRDRIHEAPKNKKETSIQTYHKMKRSLDLGLKGYYGFALSFGGKYFGGWPKESTGKRDYIKEAYNNCLKQSQGLQGINFLTGSYLGVTLPDGCIIYCDPPYKHSTGYNRDSFDYKTFWNWVRKHSKSNYVYVSEFEAPNDFKCIWEKDFTCCLSQSQHYKKVTEKLFVHKIYS